MPDELNSNAEELEAILVVSLQRTIDFLKFAEAKNGALITFSSAWVIAIINLASKSGIGFSPTVYEIEMLLPFIIANLISLLSFFPRVQLPKFLGGKKAGPHRKNLLYFGDVAKMTILEYERAIRDEYRSKTNNQITELYTKDLSVQIFVNSQITTYKLRCFKAGLFLIGFGILIVTITFLKLIIIPWLIT